MCNCNQSYPCLNCSGGLPCNCPPNYAIIPAPVPCNCCPSGYTYAGVTANYPNGSCTSLTAPFNQVAAIPCTNCEESISTDCVVYQCVNSVNAAAGSTCSPCGNVSPQDTLTTIIQKICPSNPAMIMSMFQTIAGNQQLLDGLCNVIALCGSSPGSSTPIIGTISFTIP